MKPTRRHLIILIALLFAFTLLISRPIQAMSRSAGLDWWVMGSGGGVSTAGSSLTLQGTMGQPMIGFSNQGVLAHSAGFWQRISEIMLFLPLLMK